MIIKPTGKLDIHLYVDADFAGLYGSEPDHDPISVRSRTGYIIKLSNCPLGWRSFLQGSVSCHSCESEYRALSAALKTLLPLKRLICEIVTHLSISEAIRTSIRARVFEDNQAALSLATNHRITNRTRYLLVGYHWFWEFYPTEFSIERVDTHNQDADYYTKGPAREPFEATKEKPRNASVVAAAVDDSFSFRSPNAC